MVRGKKEKEVVLGKLTGFTFNHFEGREFA